MNQKADNRHPSSFRDRMKGSFDGLVRIDDARQLAVEIETFGPWFLNQPTQGETSAQVSGSQARQHLEGLLEEILKEEKGVWTTMVYVQSRENPEVIKVFHPRRAGCGCGGGGGIVPWWILSRIAPEAVPGWSATACIPETGNEKKSWFGRFFP
ncbi:MAG: hypothetical protein HQL73_10595 [Magnetococcales bacterium]|nr:hypothetical protein [Magnetococcales bacterium]